jgi:hypothetical protein
MFPIMAGNSASTGYNLTRSLRFRASASGYLNRTPATATNRQTWTWSGWVKRGTLGTSQGIFAASTSGSALAELYFNTSNALSFYDYTGAYNLQLVTTQVFRDPSAWYHIVVALDTTNATAANRVKIYVNGAQVTALSTATYPSQNYQGYVNNNIAHYTSSYNGSTDLYDGYLTEVNFIDGQALTPSSFGSTNALTGVWQPARYTGTYGTNGFYLPFNELNTASYAGSFNGSNQSISLPSSSVFAFGTGNFTAECWFNSTTVAAYQSLIDFWPNPSGSYIVGQWQIDTDNAGRIVFYVATSSTSAGNVSITSSATYNANTWNHVAVCRNGSTLTVYLNGVNVASTTFSGTIGYSSTNGSLGKQTNSSSYLSGYLSNVRVTNTAVYTSSFVPSQTPLTAISGTQLLTLQDATLVDNSSNALTLTNVNSVTFAVANPFLGANIASDQSGNANNWTPNNISLTAGVTYDSMTDVPTLTSATAANFAVLNPLKNAGTVTNANLTYAASAFAVQNVFSSMALPSTTKIYFETTFTTGTVAGVYAAIGIATQDISLSTAMGTVTNSWAIESNQATDSINRVQGAATSYGAGTNFGNNDVCMVAVDQASGKIWYGKNGTWFSSGDPAAGTNAAATTVSTTATLFPVSTIYGTSPVLAFNFGQRPFTYTAPTGFVALNTYNLPTSTILKGNTVMDATLYTGTGSSLTITNAAPFKPDLVWIKVRSNAVSHALTDSVRGISSILSSDLTSAEATQSAGQGLTAFNSNGFSLGTQAAGASDTNFSGRTYVGWQWQAGQGSTSSNTNGSITSTVSVNASAGFSVVTYTGNGTTGATIGHGLGVAPQWIVIKERNQVRDWTVYHISTGNTGGMRLNGTGANETTRTGWWNNTTPSSSVITLGGSTGNDWFQTNESTGTYVAYCWTPIAGFSAFGSYTGNGSADGVFVYTGFKPKFVLIKRTDSAGFYWRIWDSSRATYNAGLPILYPNVADAEDSVADVYDLLSNGFKLRTTTTGSNASGGTYIYAAFAENPFRNSLAR